MIESSEKSNSGFKPSELREGMSTGGFLNNLMHLTMIRHGVMSATRLMYCTSTAMREADVDFAVTAMHESLTELRPYIEADWPSLAS